MYPVLSQENRGNGGLPGINGTTSLTEAQELTAAMIKSLETIKSMEEQVKELQSRLAASLAAAELESKQKNDPLNIPITGILKFVPMPQEADQKIQSPVRDEMVIGYPSAPNPPLSGICQLVADDRFQIKRSDIGPEVEEYISICRQCKSQISYVRLVDGIQKCSNCDDTDRFVVSAKDVNEGKYPVIDSEDVRQFKEEKKNKLEMEQRQQEYKKEIKEFTVTLSHIVIGFIGLSIGSFLSVIFDDSKSYSGSCRRY